MGKIFRISNLPVSHPFPSLEFGRTKLIQVGGEAMPETIRSVKPDTFVKKTHDNPVKTHLAKFFQRKHTKV